MVLALRRCGVAIPLCNGLYLGQLGRANPLSQPDKQPTPNRGQRGLAEAALLGCCPRCGERTLFDGTVKFADRCSSCQLDYTKFNVGDGASAFLTLIGGALVIGLALWLETALQPPIWVHMVLWIPLTILVTVYGLRVIKGALLILEYRHNAGEAGRRDP